MLCSAYTSSLALLKLWPFSITALRIRRGCGSDIRMLCCVVIYYKQSCMYCALRRLVSGTTYGVTNQPSGLAPVKENAMKKKMKKK